MRKCFFIAVACFFYTHSFTQQSSVVINPVNFFENDTPLTATLTMNMGKLFHSAVKPEYLPATFTFSVGDSAISEQIRVIARGKVRREICHMPPIKMNFHNPTSPKLYPLNSLKLVCACFQNDVYDQLLIKEYLIYKMYNLLTDKSFHVRLLNLSYVDAEAKKKTVSTHAFFIEDVKMLAKRNDCKELKDLKLHSELTDRNQMTIVSLFEYMIGNTDWGVSANHNTILIQSKKDSTSRPFVIPYDFDYSGLVDADYAVPNENLAIENVRQRLYRGYPRTLDELNSAIELFNKQKDKIYSLVNTFQLLSERNRRGIIEYLDDFYKIIKNKSQVEYIFINQARSM